MKKNMIFVNTHKENNMAKFNEEIFDLNALNEKDLAYIGVCLEALLTKEELDKLKQDWKNIGGFETIPLWKFALNNISVSYRGE